MNRINQSSIQTKTVIVVSLGLLFSLIMLIVAQNLDVSTKPTWIKPLLENVGTTVMVAVTVGSLFDFMTRGELLNMLTGTKESIKDQIRTFQALDELGMIDAYSDVNTYSYNEILLSSSELIIVLNDGRSWLTRNAGIMRDRMLMPDKKTVFIFLNPQSKMINILSSKVQQPVDFIRQKISDTVAELLSYERATSHNLVILGHDYFNTHSVFMTEKFIVYTPYLLSPGGRNTIPVFIFEKKGQIALYQRWRTDIEHLMKLSHPIGATVSCIENPN